MNATRLLEHFDRISDAADAVPRLRRLVLDLAVRGKLVDQDEADEPASVLLSRIAAAKASVTKKSKGHTFANAAQAGPFTVPNSWTFSSIADVGEISPRNEADADTTAAFIPMAMISQIFGVAPSHEIRRWGDIKKGYTHVARGDVAVAKITPCFENGKSAVFGDLENGIGAATTELHVVRPLLIHPGYLLIFLKSPFFIDNGIPRMTGTAGQKRLPGDYFARAPLPLPPRPEQQRIVAKVDELMALCDRLEAAQVEREARRDRLVAASLARVSQPAAADAASYARAAEFHLDHFARLTTRPEHVKHLRQTILNLAVRGRLVPQDPADGVATMPSDEATGSTKKPRQRKQPHVDRSDGSMACPPSWLLAPLAQLVESQRRISYGVLVPGPDADKGIPFVRAQDLSLSSNPPLPTKKISAEVERPYARTRLRGDEILLCVVGSIGKLGIAPPSWAGANIARAVARIAPRPEVLREYLLVVMRSQPVQTYFHDATRTLAQPTLNVGLIEQTPIPLPPLAEQRRIVAKVDELMALCDQLEASLAAAATDRARLLESLLHEALAPAE
jgi:type I restriction enzyme S subunit